MNTVQIFTDGGSRGNPGPAASSYVVTMENKTITHGTKYLGVETNNTAEYTAVIIALEWLNTNFKLNNISKVNFILDSELVVRQLTKVYKVKSPQIKILFNRVSDLVASIPCEFSFTAISREKNKEADRLVNEVLDEKAKKYS